MSHDHDNPGLAENHNRIFLEPRCAVDERSWCEDRHDCDEEGCGEEAVEYIRADLAEAAVDAERKRCADLIMAARMNEIERDWRSLHSFIEDGTTVEQLKQFG